MSSSSHEEELFFTDSRNEAVLDEVMTGLHNARQAWRDSQGRSGETGGRSLPVKEKLYQAVDLLKGALFPMRLGPDTIDQNSEEEYVRQSVRQAVGLLRSQILLEIRHQDRLAAKVSEDAAERASAIALDFARWLPECRRQLDLDVHASYLGDPAATSVDEVLLCYPGLQTMIYHRMAHFLYKAGMPIIARVISEYSKSKTGIEIHPGAQIGASFFIDHGTGVVIGEKAIIGNNVRIYQGVTLGAKSFPLDEEGNMYRGLPRHPIIEDNVIIYSNATILGRVTIGRDTVIGANVWLMKDVPPGSFVNRTDIKKGGEA